MDDFWGVIKHFGPVAAAQVAALVLPAIIIREVGPASVVAQITGVLLVTAAASGAAYNRGNRDALNQSGKDSE